LLPGGIALHPEKGYILVPHATLGSLLRYLRRFHDRTAAEATDGELLRRYAGGDEAAIAALVRRHAAMVWGICRRLLDNEQDAEDASQAASLVLLRKAVSMRSPQSLAAFLHGVPSRLAQKARVTAQRRQRHEAQAETRTVNVPMTAIEGSRFRRLPHKTSQQVSTLFGTINLRRMGYRAAPADGEPVLFPLCRGP
jgi:hypothetical protein